MVRGAREVESVWPVGVDRMLQHQIDDHAAVQKVSRRASGGGALRTLAD
jgi:hypothetical protein